MHLGVISDTTVRIDESGQWYVYAPVLKELMSVEHKFDSITMIGMIDLNRSDKQLLIVNSKKFNFISLPALGGTGLLSKMRSLAFLPLVLYQILSVCLRADVIHTRGPCYPAYIGTILSFLFPYKKWWHKFGCSWSNPDLPFTFRFHRFLLKFTSFSTVTINGTFDNLPGHIISMLNPAVYASELKNWRLNTYKRNNTTPFNLVFIGAIEKSKGIDTLLESICAIPDFLWNQLLIIGEGSEIPYVLEKIKTNNFNGKVRYVGALSQSEIHVILSSSHFLLLPSHSEGFPKVIGEATAHGCIPIVSAVGSIPDFVVEGVTGFLWDLYSLKPYSSVLTEAFSISELKFNEISENLISKAEVFTYEKFSEVIINNIFE